MQFFIYAPTYNPNNGGGIVLHRLCHIINEQTPYSAYLVPFGYPVKGVKKIRRWFRGTHIKPRDYITHHLWNTPVWSSTKIPSDGVAIYPEMTEGNPLGVNHVVRWLLHQPGFHTGKIQYGSNELYFKFNSAIRDFHHENSVLSKNELKVIYYPIDIYHNEQLETTRDIESCYMIRKGSNKTFIHDENSVGLDGKSHQECAAIFRRAKRFICYDDYTAYSIFAILCGCESIVVPAEDVAIEQWYPNETDRYGIAYGFSEEQLNWARQTKHKVFEHVQAEHKLSENRALVCITEIKEFVQKNLR
ncbi:WavQ [Glaesserella sp.]|uniref:WavQ n=1 Tax=Glaesserella sp. TaxID=2094731 RepID=UPI0035A0423D